MTTTTPKPRVVVADDSALMRRIVTNVLTKGGIDVVGAAKDGDEALALCERETPDAMTKHLPSRYKGLVDYVDVHGRTKIAVKGKISEYIPNPTFDVVARPGAQEDYYRKGNPEG